MSYLSIGEASKKYGLPGTSIRYWIDQGLLSYTEEIRSRRTVKVIDEDEFERFLETRQRTEDAHTTEEQTAHQHNYVVMLSHYKELAEQRGERINELEREAGELRGQLQQLQLRLDDTRKQVDDWKEQVVVWQRIVTETAVTKDEARLSFWTKIKGLFK